MQVLRVRACDVCGSTENACRYRLSRLEKDPRTVTVDLCETHCAPIELVVKAKPVPRRKERAVTTVKAVRKRTAKKTAKR